jgi:hypothetical protein
MFVVKCAEKSDSPFLAQMGDVDDFVYGHLILEEYAGVVESWSGERERARRTVSIALAVPLVDDPRGFVRVELGISEIGTLLRWCAERRKDIPKKRGASLPREGS